MSIERHPLAQLSAYLDDALAPADQAAVDAHLDTCGSCRTRLAELRATASLIASLPDPAPTRRLVPRVAPVPGWLAPLRTMTTLASGLSVFLFLGTALLANVGGVASSGAAAPAPAALQASAAPTSASRGVVPAPAAAPTALNAADSAKASAPSAVPSAQPGGAVASAGAGFSTTSSQAPAGASAAAEVGARSDNTPVRDTGGRGTVLTSPLLWLALAIVFGIVAIGLQRRLRST
jgi:anti-sigma factor RsiW